MRRVLPVLAAAGLLVACGDDGTGTGTQSAGATTVAASDTAAPGTAEAAPEATVAGTPATEAAEAEAGGGAAPEAPEALQFSARLVGGGELDLRQYAGTTVALWFWAPT